MFKKYWFLIVYMTLLVLFSIYAALDVFVIPHKISTVDTSSSMMQAVQLEQPVTIELEETVADTDTVDNADIESNKNVEDTVDAEVSTDNEEATDVEDTTDVEDDTDIEDTTDVEDDTDIEDNADVEDDSDIKDNVDAEDNTATQNDDQNTEIGSFSDGAVNISLTEYRIYDTEIYVADVTIANPAFLRTALAGDSYGRNIKAKTSEIASAHGAILAINGDFYGAQERGYVIRNGVLYRYEGKEDKQDLVINPDGAFSYINESDITAEELAQNGAVHVLSFGPALVRGGNISVSEASEVGVHLESNPRSAIAYIGPGHYLFVASDGRTKESAGLSLYQLATVLKDLGADSAYNLDGGGSSTLVFQGRVINKPTTFGKVFEERTVSDIVYIGYQ